MKGREEEMFRIEEQEIAKAIARCKEIKPTVRIIEFGTYSVTSSKENGTAYTVKCYRDDEGFKTIDCSCPAGQHDRVCFHSMAAVSMHLYLAAVRMAVEDRARRMAFRVR